MPGFKHVEELSRRPHSSLPCVLQALPDSFLRIGARRNVEQPLIGLGVLYDGGCLTLDRKHHRAFAFLKLPYEVARTATECRQRLNILDDIEHGPFVVSGFDSRMTGR
jgi:hypothetical protein